MDIYDFTVKDANGNEVSMQEYKDKVLLIVNTATGCGFTPQYEGLQNLYAKYHDQGFEVLDFPCNQFMNQAPGTNEEILTFCQTKYHTTFTTFSKVNVNGKDADPLFVYLREETKGLFGSKIKWNFTKFLVDRTGKVISRFAPTEKPESIEPEIEKYLFC